MTPSHKKPITATKMAARTAIILLVFVAIFTGFLSGAYLWTRPAIETAANEERMKLIDEVDFDASFSFLYSSRPGTPAAELHDNTPHEIRRKGGQHREKAG